MSAIASYAAELQELPSLEISTDLSCAMRSSIINVTAGMLRCSISSMQSARRAAPHKPTAPTRDNPTNDTKTKKLNLIFIEMLCMTPSVRDDFALTAYHMRAYHLLRIKRPTLPEIDNEVNCADG
ncbi:hypothetical protein D3C80_1419450 [compost metagenome]